MKSTSIALIAMLWASASGVAFADPSCDEWGPGEPPEGPPGLCAGCRDTPADETYDVPSSFSSMLLTSPHGGYYHKPGQCNCFVADINMSSASNNDEGPKWSTVTVYGLGYDIPSSAGFGKENPILKEDCDRYVRITRMWERLEGEDAWSSVDAQVDRGSWDASRRLV